MRNARGAACLLVHVLVVGAPAGLHAPAGKRPSKQYTIEQFMATTSVTGAYFPADDRILYTRDEGGNERNHLYVRETDGSEKDLTPGDKLQAVFAGWTPAGDAFYVRSNERDPRFFDLYRHDAKGYERKLFYKDDVGYDLGAISPDGKWLAFSKAGAPPTATSTSGAPRRER